MHPPMIIADSVAALLIPVFIIFAIGMAIFSYYQAKKRREALAKFARDNGLSYDPGKDYGYDEQFSQFQCLRQGSRRYAHNKIVGRYHNRPINAFDYHYETYSTDSKGRRQTHHHHFSAVILDSELPLRPLMIRPEGFFDKVTEFLGWDDIDFESSEFSRRFYVSAPDKKWAFDVIHQETMEFLLNAPDYRIEFGGGRYVIIYRKSRLDPAEFGTAIGVVEGMLDRLPTYLLRELESNPSPGR